MSPKIKYYAAIVLLLVVYAALVWWVMFEPISYHPAPLTTAEKVYFEERFKYHGIWGAECEGENCYFYRDGKRVKL